MKFWINYRENAEERLVRQTLEALVFERLIKWRWLDAPACPAIECQLGELIIEASAMHSSFGRIYLCPGTIMRRDKVVLSVDELIERLPGCAERLTTVAMELRGTIANSALVTSFPGVNKHTSRRRLGYRELECVLHEGHPYHPCYKSRMGFSAMDQLRYAPESCAEFLLVYLAARKDLLEGAVKGVSDPFWRRLLAEEDLRAITEKLSAPDDYGIVMVHPWQWENLRADAVVVSLIGEGVLVELGQLGGTFSASQSMRTLIHASDASFPHVKLPMKLINTSSLRTLDEVSVLSAGLLSDWLKIIVAQDDFLSGGTLHLLGEHSGVMFTGGADDLTGHLGYLLREAVEDNLSDRERAIPANALALIEGDGKPFIDEWIRRHGLEAWFKQWIRVAVLPQWHLLIGYGIGSEWHAQNAVLVANDGWPVRVMLRDFHDGVEYVPHLLPEGIAPPDFSLLGRHAAAAEAHYRVDDFVAVKDLVLECLFIFNLSDVIKTITLHYDVNDPQLWSWIGEVLHQHLDQHPELLSRYRRHGDLFQSIKVESLFESRLKPKPQDDFFHHVVANPLFKESYVCG